jgi:ATP/maltotriose-dependent transcriptional regulator MalT
MLREYAAAEAGSVYVTLAERTSFARFVGDLVHGLSEHVPGMRLSLAGAYERALQQPDPPDKLAAWFARHLAGVTGTIILDDFHQAGDVQAAKFVTRAIERSPETVRWVVASRSLDDLPVASWLAHGIASLPLDGSVLRLTSDEAGEIAARMSPEISPESIAQLHASTDGLAADFVFFIRRRDTAAGRGLDIGFEAAVGELYDDLDAGQCEFVLQTALLPSLDPATLGRAAGPEAAVILASIQAKAPEIFDDSGARYQGRVQSFLRTKISALDMDRRRQLVARAARALESGGDVAGAIRLFAEVGDENEIVRLIDRYGIASMESDKAYMLHDALAALGEDARRANHAVLVVQAVMASLGGKLDVAEALFQHALQSCNSPQQHMRMRYLYASDLMRRGRLDCIALLKPDADFFEAPAEVRVAVMSALGAAYVMAGQRTIARKWADRALVAARGLNDDMLYARVQHQAAFVALHMADAERAKTFGTSAAELAERVGAFDVAASAYSVLYNVALDLEDDVEASASYLEKIAAFGGKSGSIEKQLYAWLAAYEIAIERGDARAAVGIERELAEFDVQYSGRLVMQALLPAKALQLAWYGDFARAHRILASSADNQNSTERKALRWAEIGLYAAGAGETAEAVKAVTTAWREIKRERDPKNIRLWRARILCALTFLLLGRISSPRMILNSLRRDIPEKFARPLALLNAVEALVARRSGERNYDEVVRALDVLRRCQSGGLARLLEALPSTLVTRLRQPVDRPGLHVVPDLEALDAIAESA